MKLFSVLFALLLATGTAQAGVMIEPYLGYESGTQSAKFKSSYLPSPNTDLGGVIGASALGARLGYNVLGFWAALDYMAGSGTVKYDTSTIKDSDLTRSTLGVTAGFDFPILIRAWAGYILKDDSTFKGSGTETTLSGGGYKLGVGFQGLPFISLNLEYLVRNFNSHKGSAQDAGAGYNFDQSYNEYRHNTYLLSVSLPLDF